MRQKAYYYIFSIIICVVSIFSIHSSRAQLKDDGGVFTQAQILPGISLELTGGVNQRGRRTLVQNGIIDFGNVSFVNPDLIANGDAFFRDKNLWLEAILEAKVIFNGAPGVDLTLTSIKSGGNEFSKVMYSTGLRQTDDTVTIPIQPDTQKLGTLNNSGDVLKFRLLTVVTPAQVGLLIARVQIGAEKI